MSESTELSKEAEHPGISIVGLSVSAGKRTLLRGTSADFREGEITLIVGPSGVGKSVLLRIIAGLIEQPGGGVRFNGDVKVNGRPTTSGSVGVVFQSFALFNELTPLGNLNFARASGGTSAHPKSPKELLDHLRVPHDVPTSRLSGGQRQRLAIARTLAANPNAIVYDEPTSGLDPITGKQVAELIKETHDDYGKTSVIVTHDYHSLMPIADRIYLLDPVEKTLVDLPRNEWGELGTRLAPMSEASIKSAEVERAPGVFERGKKVVGDFFVTTTNVVVASLIGLFSLIPIWKNPKWGFRFVLHYARLVAGPTAWFYLIASGIVVGFVTTYFTFEFLPYSNYTEPLIVEDLLTALGFAMYRIFVPVLATVLIAARCGAAVASDVGGRQYGDEIDALKTFQTNPRSYLLTPIMWSFVLGTPILNFVSFFVARLTSLVTFAATHPEQGPNFWDFHFHRNLSVLGQSVYLGFGWLMAKLFCCAVGIAIISYYQGRSPKYSTNDVSRGVTATILWATLWVLAVHFAFSFFEFEGVIPGNDVNS